MGSSFRIAPSNFSTKINSTLQRLMRNEGEASLRSLKSAADKSTATDSSMTRAESTRSSKDSAQKKLNDGSCLTVGGNFGCVNGTGFDLHKVLNAKAVPASAATKAATANIKFYVVDDFKNLNIAVMTETNKAGTSLTSTSHGAMVANIMETVSGQPCTRVQAGAVNPKTGEHGYSLNDIIDSLKKIRTIEAKKQGVAPEKANLKNVVVNMSIGFDIKEPLNERVLKEFKDFTSAGGTIFVTKGNEFTSALTQVPGVTVVGASDAIIGTNGTQTPDTESYQNGTIATATNGVLRPWKDDSVTYNGVVLPQKTSKGISMIPGGVPLKSSDLTTTTSRGTAPLVGKQATVITNKQLTEYEAIEKREITRPYLTARKIDPNTPFSKLTQAQQDEITELSRVKFISLYGEGSVTSYKEAYSNLTERGKTSGLAIARRQAALLEGRTPENTYYSAFEVFTGTKDPYFLDAYGIQNNKLTAQTGARANVSNGTSFASPAVAGLAAIELGKAEAAGRNKKPTKP